VKDARTEAAKEVEAYKRAKESDFKQFETEVQRPSSSDMSHTLYGF